MSQMSQNRVFIRSVFEQKIGPYKVCIFVNMGPFGKAAALREVSFPCLSQETGFFSLSVPVRQVCFPCLAQRDRYTLLVCPRDTGIVTLSVQETHVHSSFFPRIKVYFTFFQKSGILSLLVQERHVFFHYLSQIEWNLLLFCPRESSIRSTNLSQRGSHTLLSSQRLRYTLLSSQKDRHTLLTCPRETGILSLSVS